MIEGELRKTSCILRGRKAGRKRTETKEKAQDISDDDKRTSRLKSRLEEHSLRISTFSHFLLLSHIDSF